MDDSVFPTKFPPLADHHRELLHKAAITDDVIAKLKVSSNDALDAIIFPWTDGKNTVYVRKPDRPAKNSQKYVWPGASQPLLWVTQYATSNIYLLVEGVKQTLAVTSWAPPQYNIVGMNGCWGWRKVDLSWAENKTIIVFLDGDRAVNDDVSRAAEALQRTLTRYKVKQVTFAKLPLKGTDGIDDLLAENPMWERTQLLQGLIDNAAFTGRRLHIRTALEYTPKRRRWLYDEFIPEGVLCLLAGYEGTAKSTVTTDIVARITRGDLVGDNFGNPKRVIYITAEEDWDYDILPRLIAAGANLGNVLNVFIQHDTGAELSLNLQHDLTEIRRVITENDVTLIVFDSLLYFLGDGVNIDNAQPVNDILLPLVKVGMETRCTMLGILHFNKNYNVTNPLDKIANSKAFTRIARSTLMTAKNDDHFVLSTGKINVGPAPASLKFRLETVDLPMEWSPDEHIIKSVRVEWLGQSDVDVQEIIYLNMRGENASTREIDEWLREFMDQNGGYVLGKEVIEAGRKEFNYSPDQIKRSKKRLRILHKREGFGSASRMYWTYIPADMEALKERLRM